MPSLRQLLDAHHPLLVIDAASSHTQIGWFPSSDPGAARWALSDDESGIGVFRCVADLGADLSAVGAFVFCDGPGSILGIRTTAVAIRTWNVLARRPVFSYRSLALVAHALGRAEVGVIADARRETWHHYRIGGTCVRLPTAELAGELVTPANFRHWSQLPAGVRSVPYTIAELLPMLADLDLFHINESPDAFLHEDPTYVTWTPQVHRAPSR